MAIAQSIENLLQALSAGLLVGAIYGLMCVGLALIFGVMRVINFAQGDFMMLGMYATWIIFEYAHINPQRIYRPSVLTINAVDAALPADLNVGYIQGLR